MFNKQCKRFQAMSNFENYNLHYNIERKVSLASTCSNSEGEFNIVNLGQMLLSAKV